MNFYYGDKGYWVHPLAAPHAVLHGGARLPFGGKGDAYVKPDPIEAQLDPELLKLWKDGYVMKVMKPGWNDVGEEEWNSAEQLRPHNLSGVVLPEARGVMKTPEGDRVVLFSKYAGRSVAELAKAGRQPEGLARALEDLRGDVQSMAQRGVYPADMSTGNIVYDPATRRATLIDLGGTLVYDDGLPHTEHLGGEDEEEDYMDDMQKAMRVVSHLLPALPRAGEKRGRPDDDDAADAEKNDED